MAPDPTGLLEVRDLRVRYATPRGPVHAVDGVSFSMAPGEVVAVVGESGSGKSVLARSVMGLEREVATAHLAGEVRFGDRPVLELAPRERRALWARDVGMVFQDPLTSLNPVLRVGDQIAEVLRVHRSLGRRAAAERAAELLAEVRIPSPRARLRQYPHELSGGMRQRVAIALAIACEPDLLIADEPTTALDVTVQRQVLDLLAGLTAAHGMATLLVTHDLGIAARYADRTLVMYGGRIVEEGPARRLFDDATHPYTQGLVRSIPRLTARRDQPLEPIPGRPPDPRHLSPGCRFAPRCPVAVDRCHHDDPALLPAPRTTVACHLAPGRPPAVGTTPTTTATATPPATGSATAAERPSTPTADPTPPTTGDPAAPTGEPDQPHRHAGGPSTDAADAMPSPVGDRDTSTGDAGPSLTRGVGGEGRAAGARGAVGPIDDPTGAARSGVEGEGPVGDVAGEVPG